MIMVLNNEEGFQEQNIRYLCDVGRSTKGKHKYGYIGTAIYIAVYIIDNLSRCPA